MCSPRIQLIVIFLLQDAGCERLVATIAQLTFYTDMSPLIFLNVGRYFFASHCTKKPSHQIKITSSDHQQHQQQQNRRKQIMKSKLGVRGRVCARCHSGTRCFYPSRSGCHCSAFTLSINITHDSLMTHSVALVENIISVWWRLCHGRDVLGAPQQSKANWLDPGADHVRYLLLCRGHPVRH